MWERRIADHMRYRAGSALRTPGPNGVDGYANGDDTVADEKKQDGLSRLITKHDLRNP